jgi:hypothetical protein
VSLSAERFNERMEELKQEIERLKFERAHMASNDYVHSLHVLIFRAANALERDEDLLDQEFPQKDLDCRQLISDLRKAVK